MGKKGKKINNVREQVIGQNPTAKRVLARLHDDDEDTSDTLEKIVYRAKRDNESDVHNAVIMSEYDDDLLDDDDLDDGLESLFASDNKKDLFDEFEDDDDDDEVAGYCDDEDCEDDDELDDDDLEFASEAISMIEEDELPVIENSALESFEEEDEYTASVQNDYEAEQEEFAKESGLDGILTLEEINEYFKED